MAKDKDISLDNIDDFDDFLALAGDDEQEEEAKGKSKKDSAQETDDLLSKNSSGDSSDFFNEDDEDTNDEDSDELDQFFDLDQFDGDKDDSSDDSNDEEIEEKPEKKRKVEIKRSFKREQPVQEEIEDNEEEISDPNDDFYEEEDDEETSTSNTNDDDDEDIDSLFDSFSSDSLMGDEDEDSNDNTSDDSDDDNDSFASFDDEDDNTSLDSSDDDGFASFDDEDDSDEEELPTPAPQGTFAKGEPINFKEVNKNFTVEENNIMFVREGNKYKNLEVLFNLLSTDRAFMAEKKTFNSDKFDNKTLTSFETYNMEMVEMPYSACLKFNGASTLDEKELNEAKIQHVFGQIVGREKPPKTGFFWKGDYYILKNAALDNNEYWTISQRMVENHDTENIVMGYDMINNEYLYGDIEGLRHYFILGGSGSGKTVAIVQYIYQMLMKQNTKIIFLEKGTDLDDIFRWSRDMLYKANVEELTFESLIALFTYFSLEMMRRINLFTATGSKKIQDYNKQIKDESERMPYIFFAIDEFARLRNNLDKKEDEFFTSTLAGITAVARSYGIYPAYITQSPQVETGVPTVIQNNLATNIVGFVKSASSIKTLSTPEERSISRGGKLKYGDFMISAEAFSNQRIMRTWYIQNSEAKTHLYDTGLIPGKSQKEQQEIGNDINGYSNKLIEREVDKLSKEIDGVSDYVSVDKIKQYGIDMSLFEQITGIRKTALLFLFNIIFTWFENEVAKKLRQTTFIPSQFNIDDEIAILLESTTFKSLGFVFILLKKIYASYFAGFMKQIRFSKSQISGGQNDDVLEVKENLIQDTAENIVYNINEQLRKMTISK